MAKKSTKRTHIGLVSEASGHRVITYKNKQNTPEKLRVKKFDKLTGQHEWFKETTKNLGRNVVKPKKH